MGARTGITVAATAVVVIAIGVIVALAIGGSLPWEDTGSESTPTSPAGTAATPAGSPDATASASNGAASGTPLAQPNVKIVEAFPKLPKLDRPTNMLELPTHWMLVTMQDGRVVTFPDEPSASELTTVLDMRAKVSRDGNEEGLLGMAIPPQASNGDIYLYYSAKPGERRTILSAFRMSGDGKELRIDPKSEQVLLTVPQPYSNHNGGQLAFGPDGMLYLGLGDGGSGGDPQGNGQDLTRNLLGSIIRIDVHAAPGQPYKIPPDNPFASSPNGAKPETYIYGLRNPWRFSFDAETGHMWVGDVGQGDWEEIDAADRGGGNYGWNIMEGFHCYKPKSGCNQQGLTLPVLEYGHDGGACSVTGGYVYRGEAVPSLRGWYIYGDYCSGEIWAVPAASTPGSKPTPAVLQKDGPQIPTFAQDSYRGGPPAELYYLGFDGKVYKFTQG